MISSGSPSFVAAQNKFLCDMQCDKRVLYKYFPNQKTLQGWFHKMFKICWIILTSRRVSTRVVFLTSCWSGETCLSTCSHRTSILYPIQQGTADLSAMVPVWAWSTMSQQRRVPKRQQTSGSDILSTTTDGALAVLTLLKESSDLFPPLKSAASIVISIAEAVKVRFPQCLYFSTESRSLRISDQIKKTGLVLGIW